MIKLGLRKVNINVSLYECFEILDPTDPIGIITRG